MALLNVLKVRHVLKVFRVHWFIERLDCRKGDYIIIMLIYDNTIYYNIDITVSISVIP